MEYFYLNSDYEDITINKNIFPLKMVILCFMYLLLSISISKKIEDIKPTYNPKLKNEFILRIIYFHLINLKQEKMIHFLILLKLSINLVMNIILFKLNIILVSMIKMEN